MAGSVEIQGIIIFKYKIIFRKIKRSPLFSFLPSFLFSKLHYTSQQQAGLLPHGKLTSVKACLEYKMQRTCKSQTLRRKKIWFFLTLVDGARKNKAFFLFQSSLIKPNYSIRSCPFVCILRRGASSGNFWAIPAITICTYVYDTSTAVSESKLTDTIKINIFF